PVGHTSFLGPAACRLDRTGVVVRADKGRVGKVLCHQDGRGTVAAADVGDYCAPLQLVHDPVEGGQPGADQVGVVAGPEDPFAALVHVRYVLVPAEPGPGARRVDDVRGVGH